MQGGQRILCLVFLIFYCEVVCGYKAYPYANNFAAPKAAQKFAFDPWFQKISLLINILYGLLDVNNVLICF
jgi:hypothetical protein